jgi:diguanylate cyclase (GGDEF)-like protein
MSALAERLSSEFRGRRDDKVRLAAEVSAKALQQMLILCVAGLLVGAGAAMVVTRAISRPIHELKLATDRIAEGEFEGVPSIRNRDEVGDLARAFGQMARKLKQLEQVSLDANPLTRLPGGAAIEGVLNMRLETGSPVAFCLLDLDNFKAYNDRYGYPAGSEVIKAVARIVEASVAEQGGEGDFVGHVGGDDFVVLTSPGRSEAICRQVIREFDATIPGHYSEEDRERGFIVGKTRQGQTVQFPIMSISLAVVTNEKHQLTSHLQVGEIAAELKDYAKTLPGSVFVVDRRASGQALPAA